MIQACKIVQPKKPYVPVLSAVERMAYAAAHRILTVEDSSAARLGAPGARRSARVDAIAKIIVDQFQVQS